MCDAGALDDPNGLLTFSYLRFTALSLADAGLASLAIFVSTLRPSAEGFLFTTTLELGACCDRRTAQAQDDRGCEYSRLT